jgi:ankyrin repeat protein
MKRTLENGPTRKSAGAVQDDRQFAKAKDASKPDALQPSNAQHPVQKLSEAGQRRLNAELREAARDGDTKALQELIGEGAEVDARDDDGKTALMHAVLLGETKTAGMLIDKGTSVDAKDDFGRTALMLAAENGRTETAEMLISRGAGLDARDNWGGTALTLAARYGKTGTAEALKGHMKTRC